MIAFEHFAPNLDAALNRRGLHSQVAKAAGISSTYLSRVKAGKQMPSLKVAVEIAKGLQVSLDTLLLEPAEFERWRAG